MSGKADAFERDADAPPQLHHDDRERDRDPAPPLDDLVKQRVAGAEVVQPVAAKPQLLEHERAQPGELLEVVPARLEPAAQLGGPGLEGAQLAVHVHLGIGLGRDQQGRAREVDGGLGLLHLADEIGADVIGVHHAA